MQYFAVCCIIFGMKKNCMHVFAVVVAVLFCMASVVAEDISALDLFRMVDRAVIQAHSKMVLMNKKGALSKLGTEVSDGDVSGTLTYDARMKGLGGRVTMRYVHYCDSENGIILDGETNTTANISMKGTLDGTLYISGPVTGSINHDNVLIVDGDVGGGYYLVSVNGKPAEKIDWHYALEGREKRSE